MTSTSVEARQTSSPTAWSRSAFRVPELEKRLLLAKNNMESVIDPRTGHPYFGAALREARPHFYHVDFFDVPHLVGRMLDSLVMEEKLFGLAAEEKTLAAYRRLLLEEAFSGPDNLSGFKDKEGNRKVVLHNQREGMLGLTALIRSGQDTQPARERAAAMVRRIDSLMNPDGSWNLDAIRAVPQVLLPGEIAGHDKFYCSTAGRFLGALVKYAETTGDPNALPLARRISSYMLATCFGPDGRALEQAGWHTHSVTASINSLAQLAESTGDKALMEKTAVIYCAGFGHLITRFGWSKENLTNDLDTGEVNNTGDIIQTAMILARNGHPECWSDAERMLRSHVFPSQLSDVSWVTRVSDPSSDEERDVAGRVLGAWGFPAPYGHKIDRVEPVNFNFDITCGTVQAMCEAARNVCAMTDDGAYQVNLLFSFEGPGLAVRSELPEHGRLEVETSGTKQVLVRLPADVTGADVKLVVDGQAALVEMKGRYVVIAAGAHKASLEFALPVTRTEEQLPGRVAHVWWRGEQVTRMQTSGTELPFLK